MKKKEPEPRLDEMTLRDLMAMFVVSGHVSRINVVAMPPEEVAGYVYRVADAMIEERKQK
jgi:hypothetical protein